VTATIIGDRYSVQLNHDDTLVLGNVTKSDLSWNEYKLCTTEQEAKPIYSVATIMTKGLQAPNECDMRTRPIATATRDAAPSDVLDNRFQANWLRSMPSL
jgi:hypothetical protein